MPRHLPDREIYTSANYLLETHGENAEARAEENRAHCQGRSDLQGVDVWNRVLAAIAELRKRAPAADEAQH